MYHYLYRISRLSDGIDYIGVRSSEVLPDDDLGYVYFTSGVLRGEFRANPDAFKKEILGIHNTRESANGHESFFLEAVDAARSVAFANRMNTYPGFYNTGHSDEAKQKMRVAKLGKKRGPHSLETRRKMSLAATGKQRPDISARQTGARNPMFGKSAWNKGKSPSADVCAQLSTALKGKPWSVARRAAQGRA